MCGSLGCLRDNFRDPQSASKLLRNRKDVAEIGLQSVVDAKLEATRKTSILLLRYYKCLPVRYSLGNMSNEVNESLQGTRLAIKNHLELRLAGHYAQKWAKVWVQS